MPDTKDDNQLVANSRIPRKASVIHGFRNVSSTDKKSNPNEKLHPEDALLTLDDVIVWMRKIERYTDAGFLNELLAKLIDHMSPGNKHGLKWDQLGTDPLRELYKEWSKDHEGTLEDFRNILFQNVQIADLDETLAGESKDKVPSVHGVAEVLRLHNESTDAHRNLIESVFGGGGIHHRPAYHISAIVSKTKRSLDFKHDGITVINSKGFFDKSKVNEVLRDFTPGYCAYPSFEERTNLIYPSEGVGKDTSEYNMYGSMDTSDTTGRTPWGKIGTVPKHFQIAGASGKHGFSTASHTTENGEGAFSVVAKKHTAKYVYYWLMFYKSEDPLDVRKVGFIVDMDTGEIVNRVREGTDYTDFDGYVAMMSSGWYRISVTSRQDEFDRFKGGYELLNDLKLREYEPIPNHGLFVDCWQLEAAVGTSTYKKTVYSQATSTAIDLSRAISPDKINTEAVTVAVTGQPISKFGNKLMKLFDLAAEKDGVKKSIIYAGWSDISQNKQPTCELLGNTQESLIRKSLSSSDKNFQAIVAGYGGSVEEYAAISSTFSPVHTITQPEELGIDMQPTMLAIGRSSTGGQHLNGYIMNVTMYPIKCSFEGMRYLASEFITNGKRFCYDFGDVTTHIDVL
jgi:hypothetical protein